MEQDKALAILKSGENVFLTGSAGAGKTYVLNSYIKYLKARKVPVAITASTGIAATHMNGMTIHSWAGIGVKSRITDRDLKAMKEKKYLKDKLEAAKVLIIDEISMLHQKQIELVDIVLRYFKKNEMPFGGVQVVFAGDFFQLPPVGEQGEQSRDKFVFMSPVWVAAKVNVCYLTKQYRQSNNSLNTILNEIRLGDVSPSSIQALKLTEQQTLNDDVTQLYTHNADVDTINAEALQQLKGKEKLFSAVTKGNEKLVEVMKSSVLAPEFLALKAKAKVMFVKNNPDLGVVNGTLGTVEGFTDEDLPIVRLRNGSKVIVEQDVWEMNDDKGKKLAEYKQFPLRLAWAITIHKSQGMTLDAAEIDLSKAFERGQGYVALSRLKDLAGLCLKGLNDTALKLDALARKADWRFKELSEALNQSTDITILEKTHAKFIRSTGGLTDKKEIEKLAKRQKDKSDGKMATHEKTANLIKQGMSISAIAEKRGLAESTILTHVVKIHELMPDVDLSSCKPDKELLKDIQAAFDALNQAAKNGTSTGPSLTNIYKAYDGKWDYNSIKLALIFIER